MDAAFEGICELVLESRAPAEMVDFYERLGLRSLGREGDRTWLAAGGSCRIATLERSG
ncbi:MAG TPA: hypothetical protein VHZ54_06290 [Solirubrobacterales bacterium]|jgi:hypothetical protein|nr:hypothetical protein [Solirubrobacterales bacterium]